MQQKILFSLLAGLLGLSASHAQIASFPGAEGAGAYAVGGRLGDVYHVTTTSSSQTTPGSFYYGIANAPAAGRTIVFDVSGYIHIGGTYTIAKSKITIAGQTAPGDGIGFKDGTMNMTGNDLIIRNIRFRDGNSADSADLGNNSNIMMDHCDVMLSNDENLSSFGTPPDLFTFQWSMNSWGMETHSCGGLWDQNRATCHHSLWSHNHTRNPKVRSSLLDWVNNVTFDWDIGFIMGDSNSGANWNANVRGSYFVSPPGNTHSVALEKALLQSNGQPNFHLYIDDSAMDGDGDGVLSVSKTGYALASGSYGVNATPFATAGIPVTRDDFLTAYKKVLSLAGPVRMDSDPSMSLRDELNTILVNNVVKQIRFHVNGPTKTGASNGGFGTLNSAPPPVDTDRDGMPDFWESSLGLNPNLDDHLTQVPANAFVPNSPAGYTLLEEYLQFLMLPHGEVAKFTAAVPTALDVDLHKYTLGFTNKLPVTYTISNVTNGTVTLTNGYVAYFVPPTNYFGRARFDFTVTDGDGSTWKQTFAVLVSSVALPRDLLWKGDGAANAFDTSALNFLFGTNLTVYSSGDNVTFDDGGSASPAVNIVGALTPSSLTVQSSNNYTLGGSGTLGGAMKLNQSGGGTLAVSTAHSFTGGGTIADSTLVINSGGDIGTGPFTLQNATLTSTYGGTANYTLDNALTIPDGTTSTINLSPRMSFGGLSGNGVLNLNVSGVPFNYDNLNGACAAFTGTLNITGTVPNALLTAQFNGGGFDGNLGNAEVNLNNVAVIGRHNSGGNTLTIGAFTGTATSGFQGSGYAGPMTLVVGGLNQDTMFAGSITSVNNTNRIVKVGTGKWILSGSNNFSGALIVSNGTLRVTGSDNSNIVTVTPGGILDGTGALLGGVTTTAGGKISPGFGIGSFGTLTTSNNLTLAAPNMYFDLSGSPAGANDKIVMLGGSIAMSGVNNYIFNLTDHALGAGVYGLIEGATTSTAWSGVTHNLPSGTRQGIVLNRASAGANPSYVRLTITGSAASLVWSGTNGSAWDLSTTNWLNGSAADRFFNLDSVLFDDTSTNGVVTVSPFTSSNQPAFMVVSNNARNYTINGGGIAGQTAIVKNGSGTLTLSPYVVATTTTLVNNSTTVTVTSTNGIAPGLTLSGPHVPGGTVVVSIPNSTNVVISQVADASGTYTMSYCAVNSYTGGTVVNGGTLQFVNNPYGGGVGNISLNGATLYFNGVGTGAILSSVGTNTLQTSGQPYSDFGLIGSGMFNLNIGSGGVFSPSGDWSAFSGTINFLTGNWIRELNTVTFGSSNAVWNFGSNGGLFNKNGGATIYLGAIFGGAGSGISGASTANATTTTYVIGGVNTNSVFSGTISDGGAANTALIFSGPGSLSLTGNNTYTGNTLVSGGTLRVNNTTGSGTGVGDVQIVTGATLAGTGSISGLVSIADGATFAPGNSAGTLTIGDGLVLGDGAMMNFELGTTSDSVSVTGDLTLGGTLNITNLAGFGAGTYPLFTYGGSLSLGTVTLGTKPAGYNYALSTNTGGVVNLVVASIVPPSFGNITLSGNSLAFSGNNGIPLGNYYVISSTNLALPLVNWTRVATNQFDAAGNFNFTNGLTPNAPQQFYRLQLQ